jgi:hypothetical protein
MASLSDKYKNNLPFDSSNVTTITSNYTALNNDVVFVNTASSTLTVTLPASPTAGSKIKVLDVAANAQNNIITVLGNGYDIGGASAYIINTPDSSVDLIYINSNKGWNVLSEYTTITKPGIPSSISAVDVGTGRAYNDGAATVSFTPSLLGDPATSYTVTSTPGGYTATGTSSPIIVSGLQSNTSYIFKVYATNSSGNSSESIGSSSITATTVPEAVTISSVDSKYERLTVNYTANGTGGKAVTSYAATRTGPVTISGASPIEFTGLTGGTSYTISMTATNDNGTSIASVVVQTPFTASGGSSIITTGGYRIHTFNASSNFVLTGNSAPCEYLIVAGGGGGGGGTPGQWYGAGGAGGTVKSVSSTVNAGTYAVTVGSAGSSSNSGNSSSFNSISSGGGGGSGSTGRTGGSNEFYSGSGTGDGGFGAGGGAGGAANASGSNGGIGFLSSILVSSNRYAGGGGGGGFGSGGAGGGAGGTTNQSGSGQTNTGGGGGGGTGGTTTNGGSGIVIIRYAV